MLRVPMRRASIAESVYPACLFRLVCTPREKGARLVCVSDPTSPPTAVGSKRPLPPSPSHAPTRANTKAPMKRFTLCLPVLFLTCALEARAQDATFDSLIEG